MPVTTQEAAKQLGISRQSLCWWFRLGKISKPLQTTIGRGTMRLWSPAGIARALRVKAVSKRGPRLAPLATR
jgi:DNA-binding transcriptional MerR regulator